MQLIGSQHFLVLFSRIYKKYFLGQFPPGKAPPSRGRSVFEKNENMDSCVFDPDVSVCLGRICYVCLHSSGELTTVFVIHISHIIYLKTA